MGPTWRILLGLTWLAAFFAYAAVWQASVQLGIGTWWVGPRAQPTPAFVRLLPFAVCLTVAVLVAYGVRRLAEITVAAGIGLVVFAVPDLSRSVSLAVTELVVALAVLVVGLAALTGRGRA